MNLNNSTGSLKGLPFSLLDFALGEVRKGRPADFYLGNLADLLIKSLRLSKMYDKILERFELNDPRNDLGSFQLRKLKFKKKGETNAYY